jgi:hypothetical protein
MEHVMANDRKDFFQLSAGVSWIGLISLVVSTIVFIVLGIYDPKNIVQNIVLAIAVYIVTDKATNIIYSSAYNNSLDRAFNNIDISIRDQLNIIDEKLNIRCINGRSHANSLVINDLEKYTRVRNTLVSFGRPFPGYIDFEKDIPNSYKKFLSRNKDCVWQDIISYENMFSPRYLRQFEISQDKYGDQLEVKFMKTNLPFVNFILLGDDNGTKRVYFGWRYVKDGSTENIFVSDDMKVIELFSNYFNYLWNSNQVEEVNFKSEIVSDIDGINFSTDNREGIQQRDDRRKLVHTDYIGGKRFGTWITFGVKGKHCTDIGERGQISIDGRIYDTRRKYMYSFSDKDVLSSSNRMCFSYKSSSIFPDDALCIYDFFRYPGTAIDYIIGGVLHNDDKPKKIIYGVLMKHKSFEDANLEEYCEVISKYIDSEFLFDGVQASLPGVG